MDSVVDKFWEFWDMAWWHPKKLSCSLSDLRYLLKMFTSRFFMFGTFGAHPPTPATPKAFFCFVRTDDSIAD